MSNTSVRKVKKGKLKMLLFFLIVAFFIWFLTKFSKEFTATVDAKIQYKNLPTNTVLASNNIDEISFDLTSSGFDFLSYKLKKPIITIDIADYYKAAEEEEEETTFITKTNLIKLITEEFTSNIAVKNVSVNEFYIFLDRIITKAIPIVIDSDITYQSGFQAVEDIIITPDTVDVSGPSEVLDTLKYIKTKLIKLELLSSETSGNIELTSSEKLNLTFSEEIVSYRIIVEEFTQKEISIPVEIINLPIGMNIKLIPSIIPVVFDISVSKFNAISEKDFTIICDYNKRSIEENFMNPEIVKKPFIIQNLILKNNKIEYLIIK